MSKIKLPRNLILKGDKTVVTKDYVKAKTGDLREFGYKALVEYEVELQLQAIFDGEGLNVIGKFIEEGIDVEANRE